MKTRCYGALAGAALLALTGMVQAKTIDIAPMPAPAKKTVQPAPAHRAPVRATRKISRARYARSYSHAFAYYDYYDARDVNENFYGRSRYSQSQSTSNGRESYARRSYDESGYENYESREAPPDTTLNSRDFNGGVGYGQNGDMGYQGGYGRFDPYNGDTRMNGGGMANAAAARFSVWHGYNSHNGLGNGY